MLFVVVLFAGAAILMLGVARVDQAIQRIRGVQEFSGRRPDGLVGKIGLLAIIVAIVSVLYLSSDHTYGSGASAPVVDGCYGGMRC